MQLGGFSFFGDPVTMQIMKQLVPPKFEGTQEHWLKFVLEWEKYIAKFAAQRKVTDYEKLQLLEKCLDSKNEQELQYIVKLADGTPIAFTVFGQNSPIDMGTIRVD
jgi:hypothetical protein